MKTFKIILFILFLVLIAIFGIQNQGYFLTKTALLIDFKVASMNYTATALPNWAYWGICLGLGLLVTGMRGLITAFRLGRQIRTRDERIERLKGEINSLQSRLETFIHDPYIKKHLEEEESRKEQGASQSETQETEKA